jgi:tetratricopeptide (TPR) repeat protein
MKILKSARQHAVGRSEKSASRAGRTGGREREILRSKVRPPRSDAGRSISRTGTGTGHKGRTSAPSAGQQVSVPYQTAIRNFETGVRAFQKQNYDKAAEVFEKLINIDARDVAERAQVHLRLCRQRTRRPAPAPKSADEYYALGVACLNARNLKQAIEHLDKAEKLKPHQDYIQYALAVSHALGGNTDVAFTHLEEAFALRPENRIHARRDEDFQGLAADPRFRRLIYPARD